ncbi:PREDICTED: HAPLESS, partial [Prunus dulcis]
MRNQTPKLGHTTLLFLLCFMGIFTPHDVVAVQILSKSKQDKCEKNSASGNLNCTKKIVLNMAVPSGTSGGEASIVAEIVEASAAGTFIMWQCVKCLLVENRTAISNDNFLPVNLIGDFVGYTNIPSFEDFYLVIPKHELFYVDAARERFSLDGVECNKIGVSYEAFNGQPNLCSLPLWSCLHNQLWNFWEADQNRIERNQLPLYGVEGRFERINQHPNAGTHLLSIGVTEVINTNLMIELSADDVEYVYQRSPGKIVSINGPTFEALTQFGTATITTTNTGEVEASYSLTFDCSSDVTLMEPKETTPRAFKLYPATDEAAKYVCAAILTDSDYKEVDRAECQFSTTSTVLDNVSQGNPFNPPKTASTGFFDSIESIWSNLLNMLVDFVTGKTS